MRCFWRAPASANVAPQEFLIPWCVVTHLQMCKSWSTGENSGLVITDDAPPSSGGGVSPGLESRWELMLDRDWRE